MGEDSYNTYEKTEVNSIYVGERQEIHIADPYGIVSKYNFFFD